jgi:hypothetical protein
VRTNASSEVSFRRRARRRGQSVTLADIGGLLVDAIHQGLPAYTEVRGPGGGRLREIKVTAFAGGQMPRLEEALARALGKVPAVKNGAGVYALISHLEGAGFSVVPTELLGYLAHKPGCDAESFELPHVAECTCGLSAARKRADIQPDEEGEPVERRDTRPAVAGPAS